MGVAPKKSSAKDSTSSFIYAVEHFRQLMGKEWAPLEVRFRQAKESNHQHEQLAAFFLSPIRFGCLVDELILDSRDMGRKLQSGNLLLSKILQDHLEQQAERRTFPSLAERSIWTLVDLFTSGHRASIEALAERLNVSTRTLQREFFHQDLSYQGVLKEARRLLISRLLFAQQAKPNAMARALGFSGTTSFCRNFKVLTGKTFTAYFKNGEHFTPTIND